MITTKIDFREDRGFVFVVLGFGSFNAYNAESK